MRTGLEFRNLLQDLEEVWGYNFGVTKIDSSMPLFTFKNSNLG